jgi:hypothetical protein
VTKVGCESSGCYQILQQTNKNGEKINEHFCCENLEKVLFGYRYLNSYKLLAVFKPNKLLTRQNILPGDSKNSTVDGLGYNEFDFFLENKEYRPF